MATKDTKTLIESSVSRLVDDMDDLYRELLTASATS